MSPIKSFEVFGERVDVLIDSSMTNGCSSAIVQHVAPGGGPPPHSHKKEDETFTVLEGEFEIFREGVWYRLPRGEVAYAQRGSIHTFRNSGTSPGRIFVFIVPGGFEDYLEAVSPYFPASDMLKIQEISARYGITLYV